MSQHQNVPASAQKPTGGLKAVPTSIWVGLGIGVLAFFVNISTSSTQTRNGVVVACSYIDVAGFLAAAVLVVFLVFTIVTCLTRKLTITAAPLAWVGIALIAVLAVVHALRGAGVIGGIC